MSDNAAPQAHASAGPNGHDMAADLRKALDQTRLPPERREEILAELPSPEEQKRLYQALKEQGGLSFQQLADSLGL